MRANGMGVGVQQVQGRIWRVAGLSWGPRQGSGAEEVKGWETGPKGNWMSRVEQQTYNRRGGEAGPDSAAAGWLMRRRSGKVNEAELSLCRLHYRMGCCCWCSALASAHLCPVRQSHRQRGRQRETDGSPGDAGTGKQRETQKEESGTRL